jgi:hypothetical protein
VKRSLVPLFFTAFLFQTGLASAQAQAPADTGKNMGFVFNPGSSNDQFSGPPPKITLENPNDLSCLVPSINPDAPSTGLMGGASFYLLKPYLQNNTSAVITASPGTPSSLVTQDSFQWRYEPAAAFWLGWTTPSGLGFRARYFFFDSSSGTTDLGNSITPAPGTQTTITPPLNNFLPLSTGGTAFGSPGTVLNSGIGVDHLAFNSDLHIHTVDIEATYAWHEAGWSLLASGGGRYLSLDQGYQALLVNNGGGLPVNEVQSLESTRKFSGGGLVAGLQGNVDVCHSGFSLFSSAHGSFLFGTNTENVTFSQTVNDPTGVIPPGIPGTIHISPQSIRNTDHTLSTIELELGLQYSRSFSWGELFVRTAAVSQTYFDAGNASQATGNLSLFGVQWSAGIRY